MGADAARCRRNRSRARTWVRAFPATVSRSFPWCEETAWGHCGVGIEAVRRCAPLHLRPRETVAIAASPVGNFLLGSDEENDLRVGNRVASSGGPWPLN